MNHKCAAGSTLLLEGAAATVAVCGSRETIRHLRQTDTLPVFPTFPDADEARKIARALAAERGYLQWVAENTTNRVSHPD